MLRIFSAIIVILLVANSARADDKCPDPLVPITSELKAKIEGSLDTWIKIGDVKGTGDVEKITNDVIHKYPNARSCCLAAKYVVNSL